MKPIRKIKDDLSSFFATDRAILLLCMGVSLIFWLLVKLSKEFTSYYETPIRFELPEGRTFLLKPPESVNITLKGSGWDLLSYYLFEEKVQLIFPLDQNPSQVIFAVDIRNQLAANVAPLSIAEIGLNQIRIELGESGRKKIPVILNADIAYTSGFQQQQNPKLIPDSVVINGPQTLLDSIDYWLTDALILKDVRGNIDRKISLKTPDQDVLRLQRASVQVKIPVEEFTEKMLMVPVQMINAPDSLHLFPKKMDVRLTCTVGLSQFETLNKSEFTVVADLTNITLREEKNTVPLHLTQQPLYVRNVKFSPNSIEFFFMNTDTTTQKEIPSPGETNK
jgi:hypothetical protein